MNRLTKHSALVRVILALSLAAGCKSSTEPRNDPPTAHITQPTGVLTVAESAAVIFKGNASDPEDGALSGASLAWSSNLNGALGTGDSIQITTLSAGNQVITLTATDSKGLTATATVSLTVTPFVPGNQPPQVTISSPAPGAVLASETPVTFTGSAIDPEDGALSGAALAWSSSVDGPLGTGASITVDSLTTGPHEITLTATDNGSVSASATLSVTVTATQNLGLDTVATGLSKPVFLTYPPGDTQRLFVVEQTGAIRIIKNGTLLPAAFLDITDSVTKGDEQGLLGLAFDPNYGTNGRFYRELHQPPRRLSWRHIGAGPLPGFRRSRPRRRSIRQHLAHGGPAVQQPQRRWNRIWSRPLSLLWSRRWRQRWRSAEHAQNRPTCSGRCCGST